MDQEDFSIRIRWQVDVFIIVCFNYVFNYVFYYGTLRFFWMKSALQIKCIIIIIILWQNWVAPTQFPVPSA